MSKLLALLASLDDQAPLAQRHLWLISLLDWIRGDMRSAPEAVGRVRLIVDAIQANAESQWRFWRWWRTLTETVDATTLLADFGFATRSTFSSELAERLRHKLLPATPETTDSSELFSLLFPHEFDSRWLALLDEELLARLATLLSRSRDDGTTHWQYVIMEALTYCVSQIRAAGFASEVRVRMDDAARAAQPFHALAADMDALRWAYLNLRDQETELQARVTRFKDRLDACRHAAASVYVHLDEHGISVGLIFRLRQLRERLLRARHLLDCLLSSTPLTPASPAVSAAKLLSRLVLVRQNRSSLRALIASNSSLLAEKVTERSAETGEVYITRNRDEYRTMLRKAAGGGAALSVTTLLKFSLHALGLSAFWFGLLAGLNYAICFVAIQLLHWTVATKQPAMTAPSLAAKLRDLSGADSVASFVDEVAHLVRSQMAAIVGNIALVIPCVLLLNKLILAAAGHPMIDTDEAIQVLQSLSLLGPTALDAAFTGVLLFASSIIGGWTENWFVLNRLDSAMRYNPGITKVLGPLRAGRWAGFMRENISGLASNISLGLMLGLIPAFVSFYGLGLETRHVTLAAGQITAACAALGADVLRLPALWWCVGGVLATGLLNLGVSFYLALRLALLAHNVTDLDRQRLRRAIFAHLRSHPLSFFWPPRE